MSAAELCEFEKRGGKLACPRCNQKPLPAWLPLPIYRVCKPRPDAPPRTPLTNNDLETLGPCPHLGPLLRIDGCELCGQKGKPVQVHACRHPEKQGDEVTQDRYKAGQMRTDVCRTCKLYPAAGEQT